MCNDFFKLFFINTIGRLYIKKKGFIFLKVLIQEKSFQNAQKILKLLCDDH